MLCLITDWYIIWVCGPIIYTVICFALPPPTPQYNFVFVLQWVVSWLLVLVHWLLFGWRFWVWLLLHLPLLLYG